MVVYNVFFFGVLATEIFRKYVRAAHVSLLGAAQIVVFIGLRHEIGADWWNYLRLFEAAENASFLAYIRQTDLAFGAVAYLVYHATGSYHFLNLVSVVTFTVGLYRLGALVNPGSARILFLSMVLPYLVIVAAPNYIRQACAMGLFCYSVALLLERKSMVALMLAAIAVMFHASAIVGAAVVAFVVARSHRRLLYLFGLSICSVVILLIFHERIMMKVGFYIHEVSRDSGGAYLRIIMYAIPFIVYLCFVRGKMAKGTFKAYLDASGLLLVFCVIMVGIDTIIADRLALYAIPANGLIVATLPERFGQRWQKFFIVCLLVCYALLQLNVWLAFSVWAKIAWIPYKNALIQLF